VFSAHDLGEQPHFGMRGFVVDLAYVVTTHSGDDSVVDFSKVDPVGVVEIDDACSGGSG
jgi:hypothetical protein